MLPVRAFSVCGLDRRGRAQLQERYAHFIRQTLNRRMIQIVKIDSVGPRFATGQWIRSAA
jgi:hypothetical protein